MKPTIFEAISTLKPSVPFAVEDGKIVAWDHGEAKTNETQPTQSEIDTELKKLQEEYDAQAYARARQPLYPDIGDQLDDLYHKNAFSDEMKAKIKKVKDDNPKP
tara:strand:+ start:174 stop:485 length:312 start_codon:yes stop_codon:yes gene_type:complete